jgi:hypothetical protein
MKVQEDMPRAFILSLLADDADPEALKPSRWPVACGAGGLLLAGQP